MIRVRLLKSVQPFNSGERCAFTKEELSNLPNDSYVCVDDDGNDIVVVKTDKATQDEPKKKGNRK